MSGTTDGVVSSRDRSVALWSSTVAFTVCFAAWTIFSILGVQVKRDLGLSDFQFGLLVGTPILTGSLIRLVLGIWADQHGGRVVFTATMLCAAVATFLLSYAHDYTTFLLVALGWQAVAQIWAAALALTAVLFFVLTKDDPDLAARRARGAQAESFAAMMAPLGNLQVWRFSLYYFFVFGGFVALALWLPRYYVGVYGLDIVTAGMLGAAYSIPGSLFRVLGGTLSDRYGARAVMYWTFIGSVACTFLLSYPATHYVVTGIRGPIAFDIALGFIPFMLLTMALGFFMSLGKAAVYKHIPVYYPGRVGSVGGVVGLIGGLGGFILPIAFGALNDVIGVWTSCFMLLFLVCALSLAWMHVAIRRMEKARHPALRGPQDLPEAAALAAAAMPGAASPAPASRPMAAA